MKFFNSYESKDGATVYQFQVGLDELKLLKAMADISHDHTPKVLETIPVRGRLRNIRRALGLALGEK